MQATLNTAKHFYRVSMMTKGAFPEVLEQQLEADKAYQQAGGDPDNTEMRNCNLSMVPPFIILTHTCFSKTAKEPKMRLVSMRHCSDLNLNFFRS